MSEKLVPNHRTPLVWEDWQAKPVTVQMARFTGFDDGGNGWAFLGWLEERGIQAVRDVPDHPDDILLMAKERDDARAEPGCWFVIGTRGEVYPIADDVQSDKYQPVQP